MLENVVEECNHVLQKQKKMIKHATELEKFIMIHVLCEIYREDPLKVALPHNRRFNFDMDVDITRYKDIWASLSCDFLGSRQIVHENGNQELQSTRGDDLTFWLGEAIA